MAAALAADDRVRRLDSRRAVEYQALAAYADQARARAQASRDPIDRALLAAISEGATVKSAAQALGIPATTAVGIVRRLMG